MCGRFVSFLSGVDLLQLLSYQLQTLSLNMRNVTTLCHKKTQLGKGSETFRAPGHKEFNRLQVSAHGKPTRSSKPTSPRLLKRRPIARKEEDIRNQAIITKGSSDYANCPITADFLTTSIPYCLESPFRFSRGLILTTDGDFCITRDAYWGRPESAPKGSDIFSGSYWPKHIFELFDSSFACQLLELELLGLELSSYDVHCYSVALCPKVPPEAQAFSPNLIVSLDISYSELGPPELTWIIADASGGQMDKDSFHFSFERPLCFSPMMALLDTTTFIVPLSLSSSLWTVSGEIRIERDGSIALSRFDCLEFLLSAQGPPAVDMTATLPIEFVKILEPGIKDRLPDWSYIELSDTFSRGLVSVTRRQRIREPFWTSTVPNSSCERPYRIRIIVKASKNKGSKLYLSFQPDEDTTRPTFMHQKQARYIGDSRETFPQTIWEYKILKRISQGERGLVHRATFETSNGTTRDCIIKRIKKDPESAAELDILHTLRQQPHLNCTQMLTHFEDIQFHYIVMDDLDKDLFEYIEAHPDINEDTVRHIFKQIVDGVYHLHHRLNIIHRDIKDENIMIDRHNRALLIDFGSAMFISESANKPMEIDTFAGTIEYAAPEIMRGCCYEGRPQDMWAMGILLYTMIYRENPFCSPEEILRGEIRYPFQVSHGLQRLIQGLLNQDIARRLTVEQVKQDTWLHQPYY